MQKKASSVSRNEKVQSAKEKAEELLKANPKLSLQELTKKAQQSKSQKVVQQSEPIKKVEPEQKPPLKKQQSEEVQTQSGPSQELLNLEKQFNLKFKDQQKEIASLKEKCKLQETQIQQLAEQNKSYRDLIDNKIQQSSNFTEKRTLILLYSLLNKNQYIKQMTFIVQQTKLIQYELEAQVIVLSIQQLQQLMNSQDDKSQNVANKLYQRLQYVQSQQLHENCTKFDKQNSKQNFEQMLLQLDQTIANIVSTFDKHRHQYVNKNILQNFVDTELISQLEATSLYLQQFIQTGQNPKIKVKPLIILVEEQFQRVNGAFSTIYPHLNDFNELIRKQIQNDAIYLKIADIDEKVKSIETSPISMRLINILRSLLVHMLIQFHLMKAFPKLQTYELHIVPFFEKIDLLSNQYRGQNEEIGGQIIFELCKQSQIANWISKTHQELEQWQVIHKSFISEMNLIDIK